MASIIQIDVNDPPERLIAFGEFVARLGRTSAAAQETWSTDMLARVRPQGLVPAQDEAQTSRQADSDDEDNGDVAPEPQTHDSAGYPWDARIHAASKALNKDLTWRQRRNLDPAILATVLAETVAPPPPPVETVAPPPPPVETVAPPPPPVETVAPPPPPPPVETVAPPPPPVETVAPPPPPPPAAAVTIGEATQRVVNALNTRGLKLSRVVEVCAALGIENGLAGLGHHPHLIPTVLAELEA